MRSVKSKFVGFLSLCVAICGVMAFSVGEADAQGKGGPPPGFFNGENLTMKIQIAENQYWYLPILNGDQEVPLSYFEMATSFIPFATYGPHVQAGPPTRTWSGYCILSKFNNGWDEKFMASLTFNEEGIAFADNQQISGRTTGTYKLEFFVTYFKEDGVTKEVAKTNVTIQFTVVND